MSMRGDIEKLVAEITKKYPKYGKWDFDFEYPGYFVYYLKGGRLMVYFTPDHSTSNVIDIQVTDKNGDTIESSEVPFTKRTADNLFHAAQPYLDKYEDVA
jgi:hypothetical protein